MADPRFFDNRGPFELSEIARVAGAHVAATADPAFSIADVASLETASAHHLVFIDHEKRLGALASRGDVACIAPESLAETAAVHCRNVLIARSPAEAFAKAAHHFYPDATRAVGASSGDRIDSSARIAAGAVIEPGAVIGPRVEIGSGSRIGANAVIGRGVAIGRDCYIGANVTIVCALIGDGVIVHPGARIGQDGYGYVSGAGGHLKIPQLGRVIVQDRVEIGANVTVDRGALGDTQIGEGTKIDNLSHIGHNDRIGRHCLIIAQVGLSGSVTLGDYVVLAGQVGIADHVTVGSNARLAARSAVLRDLPGNADYGGVPAKPAAIWKRELAAVSRLVKGKKKQDE